MVDVYHDQELEELSWMVVNGKMVKKLDLIAVITIYGEEYFNTYHPIWYVGSMENFNIDNFSRPHHIWKARAPPKKPNPESLRVQSGKNLNWQL